MYTRYSLVINCENNTVRYVVTKDTVPPHCVKFKICGCGVVYPEPIILQNTTIKAIIFARGVYINATDFTDISSDFDENFSIRTAILE